MNFFKNILVTLAIVMGITAALAGKASSNNKLTLENIIERIELPAIPNDEYNILDFGAIGDGVTDCKPAIDSAFALMSTNGGGKLLIPEGEYLLNGPIHLKSHVNLHLAKGCRILFSQNPKHYLPMKLVRWEGVEVYNYSPYIYANNESDIAITGLGTFDGQAIGGIAEWRNKQKPDQKLLRQMGKDLLPVSQRVFGEGHYLRMSFIQLMHCRNILISDIRIEDVPFWVVHPTYCKSITIQNVKVNSTRINNDGIDLDSSEDALIEDCTFNAGDDAIAIKSGRDNDAWQINRPSRNIVIRNCFANDVLHGLAFGSEMSGGMENIFVENFYMKNVKQYAIQFKSNLDRGAYIKQVYIDGVFIDKTQTAIFFTNNYHSYSGGNSPSDFYDISIENVVCNKASGRAIDIQGLQENPIHHITLKNILIVNEGDSSLITNTEESILENISVRGEDFSCP